MTKSKERSGEVVVINKARVRRRQIVERPMTLLVFGNMGEKMKRLLGRG